MVPYTLKGKVLHLAHYTQFSGHPGGAKSYLTLRKSFYWPILAMDGPATAKAVCDLRDKSREAMEAAEIDETVSGDVPFGIRQNGHPSITN